MKSTLTFLLSLVLTMNGIAQITTNELPSSFDSKSLQPLSSASVIALPTPNLKKLAKEDAIDESNKDIPWRFGTLIPVNYNPNNSGNWTDLANGKSIWKLTFSADQAQSLNFNFNDFYLTSTAKLFIYNQDQTDVLGAITSKNNKASHEFATRPILGKVISMQLEVNTAEKNNLKLNIDGVVYGYRSIRDKANKTFNSSGSCNINVECPIGDRWDLIKRSVFLVTAMNNTRICTGTLINNIRQDSTPFVLSASHCGLSGNNIFIFNYKSPSCNPNIDGPLNNSISGAVSRAQLSSNSSDFHLFELSSTPPASYNVVYAGWSAVNAPPIQSAGVHHPRGDVMKMSVDSDVAVNSGYYSTGIDHWKVENWEFGTTEGGSSGSGLFDQNQRLVGQLHGGNAACGNNAEDYYGKLAYSWTNSSIANRQLRFWLDPDTTGILTLDPLDPNPATFNDDLELVTISGLESFICDTVIQPTVAIRNKGNNAVNSFQLNYRIDNGATQSLTVNQSIARNQIASVVLPSISVVSGFRVFTAEVSLVSITDQDLSNNSDSVSFQVNANPLLVNFSLTTDDYGDETTWLIRDNASQNVLFQGGPYAPIRSSVTYTETLCLYDSCFTLELFDSANDGFTGSFGNGNLLITDATNDTLVHVTTFTGASRIDSFCVVDTFTDIEQINRKSTSLTVFPNPIKRGNTLNISIENNELFLIELFDITGRLITSKFNSNALFIDHNLSDGIYFVKTTSEKNKEVSLEKIIVH